MLSLSHAFLAFAEMITCIFLPRFINILNILLYLSILPRFINLPSSINISKFILNINYYKYT